VRQRTELPQSSLYSRLAWALIREPEDRERLMNWDRIEGNWKQVTGKAQVQWGKLTSDDLDVIAGRREVLAGKIQERYGVAKDEAEKQLAAWEKSADDSWFA
jgi:uncharacterized protein YjbJ (UPF0337 family)